MVNIIILLSVDKSKAGATNQNKACMITRSMYKMELREIDTSWSCVVQSVDIIWCDKFPGVQSTK